MTRYSFFFLLAAITFTGLISGCHRDGLSREQRRVRRVAEQCYAQLRDGHYDRFVGLMANSQMMSDGYRDEMCVLVQEFAADFQAHHGVITDIHATGDSLWEDRAHVHLRIVFADSTAEEIGLPMVKVDGVWLME